MSQPDPAPPDPPPRNPSADDPELVTAEIYDAELASLEPPVAAAIWKMRQQPAGLVEPTFHVPQRFSMSGILGIITALAILFGILRAFGAHEVLYLYFGMMAMIICLVQMRFGDLPRQASIVAGAVTLPVFLIGVAIFSSERLRGEFICLSLASIPIGGFFGYLTGTLAGGIFLVMDMFEKFWTRRAAAASMQ